MHSSVIRSRCGLLPSQHTAHGSPGLPLPDSNATLGVCCIRLRCSFSSRKPVDGASIACDAARSGSTQHVQPSGSARQTAYGAAKAATAARASTIGTSALASSVSPLLAATSEPRQHLPDMAEVLDLYGWMLDTPLEQLMAHAAELRDQGPHAGIVSFSPKVFLPLTRLCRDTCGYCTFAQPPRPGRRAYMTMEEVRQVAVLGASAGCSEALFTLGDKPEERWPQAAEELREMGYGSTLEYVEAAAQMVLRETGLLPHINAGVMSESELARLKKVSASQGLMLESTSLALLKPGWPHHGCPDKHPAARLATIEAAGRAAVPYTSGILVGIGDTRADRLHALACLRRLHAKYGHIQELIIQNFRAKPGTAMFAAPEPPLTELLWAVAAARIMFGPEMSIQVPPNLTPLEAPAAGPSTQGGEDNELAALQAGWRALLDAGINDWGGISPLTRDYVNPERPWPHLAPLAAATAAAGKLLLPRLPIYPPYLGLRASRRSPRPAASANEDEDSLLAAGPNTPHPVHTRQSQGPPDASTSAPAHHSSSSASSTGSPPPSSSSSIPSASVTAAGSSGARQSAGSFLSPWLDFSGGRESPGAAVLRSADSEGFLRASNWVAGRPEPEADLSPEDPGFRAGGAAPSASVQVSSERPGPATDVRPSTSASAADAVAATATAVSSAGPLLRSSVPLPRWREGRAWQVEVGADGALAGVERPTDPSPRVVRLLEGVLREGRPLQVDEVELLLRSRGADHDAVVAAADELRRRTCGDTVSYVVNRNINYTNVCTYKCSFCAFSKGKAAEELRGPAYVVPYEEITRRAAEAWERGATEVCMQGGIHPDFDGTTYLRILAAAKAGAPRIHVHAFSPLEVHHGATSLGLSYESYLERLASAGLGSLPGTAAEVLDDHVRQLLCPDKIDTATWLRVVGAAHRVGLRTTSTLMFGSLEEGPAAWATHLVALRELQQRAEAGAAARGDGAGSGGSGGGVGLTEFVPLPFVHMEAPVYLKGSARRGPTLHEGVLLHAVSRLALHPHVTNIQASWVKMGPARAGQLLAAGCNDMGGSIMNETITRAAGASYGQELPPVQMEAVIRAAGRTPRQRTTLYGVPPAEQTERSYGAAPLRPLVTSAPSSGALR